MQSLDVISINIWHILISLCNLILLFLVVKKFLFKPVKNLLASRQAELAEGLCKITRRVWQGFSTQER